MSSLKYYAVAIASSALATRSVIEEPSKRDYYTSTITAVIVWTLAKFIYTRLIYIFYTSSLLHIPLIKREEWSECFAPISPHAYLHGMDNIPNNGLLRRVDMLNREVLIMTTPEVANEFFQKRHNDTMKWPAVVELMKDILGHGLVTVEGEEHRKHRKQMTPAFQPSVINKLYPLFWSKASHCASVIESTLAEAVSAGSKPIVDMADIASRAALDIISEAGFGTNFRSLDEPDSAINKLYRHGFMIDMNSRLIFIATLMLSPKIVNMFTFVQKIKDKLNGTAGVRRWLQTEVLKRQKALEDENRELTKKQGHNDIVSAILRSSNMDTKGLVEQSLTFLGAGHETSATAFTWGIHELAQPENQKYQTTLREELRAHLPSLTSNTPMTAELLDSLPLLDAIIKETIRLHAPIPITGRIASRDFILNGCFIPKGTTVRISMWAFGRSKKLWGDNAAVFRPERWIELKEKLKNASPEELRESSSLQSISFISGPRACIGKNFAIAELKALLAATVGRFEFNQIDNKHVEAETVFAVVGKITDLKVEAKAVEGW